MRYRKALMIFPCVLLLQGCSSTPPACQLPTPPSLPPVGLNMQEEMIKALGASGSWGTPQLVKPIDRKE